MKQPPGSIDAYLESPDEYQERLLDILQSADHGLERRTLDHRMDYSPEELGLDSARYDTENGLPPCDDTYHQVTKRFTRKIIRDLWRDEKLDRVRCEHGDYYLSIDLTEASTDVAACYTCHTDPVG